METKLFEQEEETSNQAWNIEDIKSYVKQFMVYEEEIKALQESKREWSKEFIEKNNLPKKELSQALMIVKRDLDKEVISEIIDTIEDIFTDNDE